jgi:hypothetical protein
LCRHYRDGDSEGFHPVLRKTNAHSLWLSMRSAAFSSQE